MNLADFLLARIAEDEEWLAQQSGDLEWCQECGFGTQPTSPYSLSRLMRECEAKRRIVERHKPFSHGRCQACYSLEDQDEWTANLWPCPDLRDIALTYAAQEDFREEWRP